SSPSNSVDPHSQTISGFSLVGSTGSMSSLAAWTLPHRVQYHTGIGVAKILCLEMHQSQSMEPVQLRSLVFMCSGIHFISSAASLTSGMSFLTATNHCFLTRISMGVLHLQQVPTFCFTGSFFTRKPSLSRSSTIFSLHSAMVKP